MIGNSKKIFKKSTKIRNKIMIIIDICFQFIKKFINVLKKLHVYLFFSSRQFINKYIILGWSARRKLKIKIN